MMSVFAQPLFADTAARLMQRAVRIRPTAQLRFQDVEATSQVTRVPTRHGEVRATAFQPPGGRLSAGVYVNFHGGGFVLGHYEQDDPLCRYLAVHGGINVLNVDYALAPEHRFPVQVEQAYDVLNWAADPRRDWDGSRLAVGGQSAGGAIAAGAARLARDEGGPRLRLHVLHYAPLDLVVRPKQKKALAPRAMITPWLSEIFNTAYIPDVALRSHPLASPAWQGNIDDVSGVAPAIVITCELDRLRDEGVRYARALDHAGVLIEHLDLPGVDHAYNLFDSERRSTTEHVYRVIAEHVARVLSGDQ